MKPHNLKTFLLLLLPWTVAVPGAWASGVSGTVHIEKTRVPTDGPKSQKDVIVSLEPLEPGKYAAPARHAEMDQKGLVFIPHVMAVQKGTPVDFLNSDNDRHNVFFLFEDTGKTLDIGTWGPGQTVTHTFQQTGPLTVLCQLHLEMAAYILVLDHPFYQVVDIDPKSQTARFRIDDVPPGRYRLQVWHKKLKQKGEPVEVLVEKGKDVQADVYITKSKYAK